MTVLTVAVVTTALVLAAVTAWWGWRDKPAEVWQFALAALVELLVVAYDVVAFVRLGTGDHPHQRAVYIGYLIGILVVLPVAAALALAERSRYGTLILALGAVVVPVLVARIHQVHG